jgi:hypothetical protein
MDHLGIGLLIAQEAETINRETGRLLNERSVYEARTSRFDRKAWTKPIREKLCDEQKSWAPAGNANGARFTPWQATCKRWAEFVAEHPGCTLTEIVTQAQHHYYSDSCARTSMVKWIESGRVPGIEVRREGRIVRLFPTEAQ